MQLRGGVELEEINDEDEPDAMNEAAAVEALRQALKMLKADDSLLHKPELEFFRDYLVSMGATLPRMKRKPTSTSTYKSLVTSHFSVLAARSSFLHACACRECGPAVPDTSMLA